MSARGLISRFVVSMSFAAFLFPFDAAAQQRCPGQPITPVLIGPYDPGVIQSYDATGTFAIKCQPGNYLISASAGLHGAGVTARRASNGTNTIAYNLFTTPAHATVWGDLTSGSGQLLATVAANASGTDIQFFARVPPGQAAVSNTIYTDTVNVTVFRDGTERWNGPLQIQIEVLQRCHVVGSDLVFGTYDPVVTNAAAPLDASSSIQVYCTAGTTATVGLNTGLSGNRQMQGPGGSVLQYELFQDAARTTAWTLTSTQSGTSTSPTTPIGGAAGWTVFGRIPGGQNAVVGSYSDTVSIVINY